jgi:hypothetical protein
MSFKYSTFIHQCAPYFFCNFPLVYLLGGAKVVRERHLVSTEAACLLVCYIGEAALKIQAKTIQQNHCSRVPYRATLVSLSVQGQHITFVSELCATDLHCVLEEATGPMPPAIVKCLMKDIISGVAGVHEAGEEAPRSHASSMRGCEECRSKETMTDFSQLLMMFVLFSAQARPRLGGRSHLELPVIFFW